MPSALPLSHFLLALAVVAVWGTNFVVIRIGLDHLPPLLFAWLRFAFAFLPAAFFIRRPRVSWLNLASYGVLIGAGQFGVMFIAIDGFISPGLASLVVQAQVFFTIGLSMWRTGERVSWPQVVGLGFGVAGIAVIAAHTDASTTPLGLALVLVAALSWAAGNTVARESGATDMLSYVVWASLFSLPPLGIAALLFEGAGPIAKALATAGASAWASVLWQATGNTLFGYAAWGWLLARHPAASVVPTALLVPVFGLGAASFWLGEPLPAWKLIAAALVIGGVAASLLGSRLLRPPVSRSP